jgi:sporulation protein YlmC with PRC-barrel domain
VVEALAGLDGLPCAASGLRMEEPMDAESLKGMPVVSIAEASRLGRVTDVLLETQPLRIGALRATGDQTDFVIPFDQVRTLGADAVMVESSQVTQMASAGSAFGDLRGLADLKKLKVVDEAGTFLGKIAKIELDPVTGHVARLVARRGGILGVGGSNPTIEVTAIRSVGSEVLTVGTDGKP